MRTLIKNAILVNEGKSYPGSLVIENDILSEVLHDTERPKIKADIEIDATGCYLLPGVIDDHVHFRDPGLTHKADIETESRAAAAGGVTSYFDMPNTIPQTTTLETLKAKQVEAAQKSIVNYSFFFGATNNNTQLLTELNPKTTCGVKLFMGSSTGNMLVDREESLRKIFETSPLPIMAHCEDTQIILANTNTYKEQYGEDPNVRFHPFIRSAEACYQSTHLAVMLAEQTGARLHIAHLTTAKELELFRPYDPQITAEVCVPHLYFTDSDYETLGTRIKCNPAIKTKTDRNALRNALTDGRITTIGTDHAPHLLKEKEGGCIKAVSGMPMIQFSLVTMLELVDEGVLSIERMVTLMCHNPANLFQIKNRGFLRKGYKADVVLVRKDRPWTLIQDHIESKCNWSPMEGHTFAWSIDQTYCNGHLVYNKGIIDSHYRGEALTFSND
ncbi:MAG: dihydroorotase [Bacteroidaceae bacterium]